MWIEVGGWSMGLWSLGLGALGAAFAGILLANTDLLLPKAQRAMLAALSAAELRTLDGENRTFRASELWAGRGAVIMAVRRPG
uniref:Uncharacterized protein n=3 Tax=Callorhinchus milii TaxID=7868 RepID=A0A4W3GSJ3_CALMI